MFSPKVPPSSFSSGKALVKVAWEGELNETGGRKGESFMRICWVGQKTRISLQISVFKVAFATCCHAVSALRASRQHPNGQLWNWNLLRFVCRFRGWKKRVFRFVHFNRFWIKIHNQPESLKADVLCSPFPPMLPIEMTKSSLSTALN